MKAYYLTSLILKCKKLIIRITEYIVFQLVKLIPKSRVAVFGCYSNLYADNSKYLFEFLSPLEDELNIKLIWISGSRNVVNSITALGYRAYYRYSISGIYYCVISRWAFYNSYISDVNKILLGGAKKINLWHGMPLKEIEFDISSGELFNHYHPKGPIRFLYYRLTRFFIYEKPDLIIAPSEYIAQRYKSAFRIDSKKIAYCSHPRTDNYKINKVRNKEHKILYVPTWRDNGSIAYIEEINWDKMSKLLTNKNAILVVKLHPNLNEQALKKIPINNVIVKWDKSDELYENIIDFSLIISDYSSIILDAVYLSIPVLLFQNDFEEYIQESRKFYNLSDFELFEKATHSDELISKIDGILNYERLNGDECILREKFWTAETTSFDYFTKYLKSK